MVCQLLPHLVPASQVQHSQSVSGEGEGKEGEGGGGRKERRGKSEHKAGWVKLPNNF